MHTPQPWLGSTFVYILGRRTLPGYSELETWERHQKVRLRVILFQAMEALFLPLPFTQQVRPEKSSIVFDNGLNRWKPSAMGDCMIMDSIDIMSSVCSRNGAHLDTVNIASGYMVARCNAPATSINNIRASILGALVRIEHQVLPLDSHFVYVEGGNLTIVPQFAQQLENLGRFCNVAIVVTRNGFDHDLHIYGDSDAAIYARYRAKVLLEHIYGLFIAPLDVPYSMQPLLCGPRKVHLLHIFSQTGVNVYTLPQLLELQGTIEPINRSLDEIFLVGDAIQVQIAKKLVANIFERTDTIFKDVQISRAALECLVMHFRSEVEEIMTDLATFIQLPLLTAEVPIVRVLGTNRSSIECSIQRLMVLCCKVYTARLDLHDGKALAKASITEKDVLGAAEHGATILSFHNSSFLMSGTSDQVKATMRAIQALPQVSNFKQQPVFDLELGNELKDFIAGKKMGKISRIVSQTGSYIWFSPLHDYNFHVHVTAKTLSSCVEALKLLEEELPAEKWLYVPEPYHKQVIGSGGTRIQSLMRKYNVYIKFSSSGDKIPNAFGQAQIDNVLIRCPAKNKAMLASAAEELLETVDQYAREHQSILIRVPRNHRRLLLSEATNAMRDIEIANNTLINLPLEESRNTELVPVTGMGNSAQNTVEALKQFVPIDYEFRVAMGRKFDQAVGVGSDFAAKVVAPLCIAFNAQIQAFERVQMQNDSCIYSQIVVSISRKNEEALPQIADIITAYLRDNGLDIIDKGPLHTDPVVESKPVKTLTSQSTSSNPSLLGDVSMETYDSPVKNPGKPQGDIFTSFFHGGMPPAAPKWGTPRPKTRINR